jgi:hypothetical protein
MYKNYRFWVMWMSALAVVGWYFYTDPDSGEETISRLQWLAWILVVAGPVYLVRRALHPEARSADAYQKAMQGSIGAGLVFLGLSILTGLLFLAFAGRAGASGLPEGAVRFLPLLLHEQQLHWPDMPLVSSLPAQVEQETCASLHSPRCWNPRAELKTSREYGFGLGQLTVTPKFNNFEEARKLDNSLRDWQFSDRYDPVRQLRAMVLMDKSGFNRLSFVPDPVERLAMAYSAYNGGLGGVLADRRLCASVAGCDANRWFGHVEHTSLKAKSAVHGYGQSFFAINRGYVRAIMIVRRQKYVAAGLS